MYYATGLPGWVRFGYSPGWGGLPPAAQYLRDTGQLEAFLRTLPAQGAYGARPWFEPAASSREEEIAALLAQKAALERSVNDIARRIEALQQAETEEEA